MKFKSAVVTSLIVALVGCATPATHEGKATREMAENLAETYTDNVKNLERPFIIDSGQMKVTGKHFKNVEKPVLPPAFSRYFSWSWTAPEDYKDLAELIGGGAGVRVRFTSDAVKSVTQAYGDRQESSGMQAPQTQQYAMQVGGDEMIAPITGGQVFSKEGEEAEKVSTHMMTFSGSGTLSHILDLFVSKLELNWKYQDDSVVIFKTETRNYTIDTLPGAMSHSGVVSSNVSSSGNTSTSSSFSSAVEIASPEIWEVLSESVSSVLSAEGRFVSSPQTGSIKVTDDPDAHERVRRVIDQFNEDLSLTIFYKVDIVDIVHENTDQFKTSFADLVYSVAGNEMNVATGASDLDSAASTFVGTIVRPGSRADGSSVLIGALSKKVDVVSHKVLYGQGTNGVTVPIQDVREITYLASRSIATNETATTVSITPGTATEGISLFLTGMRGAEGHLLLQSSLDMSVVEAIVQHGVDDNFIQGPTIAKKNSLARGKVTAGDSMVAGLIETSISTKNRSGIGHFDNQITGGSRTSGAAKRFTMVMITPYFKAD